MTGAVLRTEIKAFLETLAAGGSVDPEALAELARRVVAEGDLEVRPAAYGGLAARLLQLGRPRLALEVAGRLYLATGEERHLRRAGQSLWALHGERLAAGEAIGLDDLRALGEPNLAPLLEAAEQHGAHAALLDELAEAARREWQRQERETSARLRARLRALLEEAQEGGAIDAGELAALARRASEVGELAERPGFYGNLSHLLLQAGAPRLALEVAGRLYLATGEEPHLRRLGQCLWVLHGERLSASGEAPGWAELLGLDEPGLGAVLAEVEKRGAQALLLGELEEAARRERQRQGRERREWEERLRAAVARADVDAIRTALDEPVADRAPDRVLKALLAGAPTAGESPSPDLAAMLETALAACDIEARPEAYNGVVSRLSAAGAPAAALEVACRLYLATGEERHAHNAAKIFEEVHAGAAQPASGELEAVRARIGEALVSPATGAAWGAGSPAREQLVDWLLLASSATEPRHYHALAAVGERLLEECPGPRLAERVARLHHGRGHIARALAVLCRYAERARPEGSAETPGSPPPPSEGDDPTDGVERAVKIEPVDAPESLGRLRAAFEAQLRLLAEGHRLPGRDTPRLASGADPEGERHIGYVVNHALPLHSGGYSTRSQGLLEGCRAIGWQTTALTRFGYPADRLPPDTTVDVRADATVGPVPYVRLPDEEGGMRRRDMISYLAAYAEALAAEARARRVSVLHAASNHVNGLATIAAARRAGLPSVYEVRGFWEITRTSTGLWDLDSDAFRLAVALETQACGEADACLAITGAVRDEIVRRGVPGERVTVLPNGVDTERFRPRARDEALARRLGLDGTLVLGFVGSITLYEGLEDLAMAMARLRAEGVGGIKCLVVGDGYHKAAVERAVAAAGVGDLFVFPGRVPHDEVEAYYSLIDVCPFPRRGLPVCEMVSPLKPFEALAMAKPIVVSSVAALVEFVAGNDIGLVHTKDDPEHLAVQLRLLAENEDLRRRLGDNARRWVCRERDWRILARRLADVYERLLAERGRRAG